MKFQTVAVTWSKILKQVHNMAHVNHDSILCSLLVLHPAGGATPKFAENTVLIWDNLKKKFILEFTFPALVLSVRLTRER